VKAAYPFFGHPEVEPERVQSAHRAGVLEQLEAAGTYVLMEDTTELDWTGTDTGIGADWQSSRRRPRGAAAFGAGGAVAGGG
jgi:hypothetical protein